MLMQRGVFPLSLSLSLSLSNANTHQYMTQHHKTLPGVAWVLTGEFSVFMMCFTTGFNTNSPALQDIKLQQCKSAL